MSLTLFVIVMIAPISYAVINHIDKYLLSEYFKGKSPAVLVIFSSMIGAIIAPIFLLINPAAINIPVFEMSVLMLSGVFFILHTIPYFFALAKDEASFVVPLFLMAPVIALIFGYVFLDETLTQKQLFGAATILIGSFGLSMRMEHDGLKFRWSVFWLMFLASFLIAIQILLFKITALQSNFTTGAFWQFVGFLVPASIMLLVPAFRRQVGDVFRANATRVLGLNLFNELLASAAVLSVGFVSLLVPLGLVVVVTEGLQPLFVLLFGILLSVFLPQIAKEDISRKALAQKFIFVAIMFLGVYMINL